MVLDGALTKYGMNAYDPLQPVLGGLPLFDNMAQPARLTRLLEARPYRRTVAWLCQGQLAPSCQSYWAPPASSCCR